MQGAPQPALCWGAGPHPSRYLPQLSFPLHCQCCPLDGLTPLTIQSDLIISHLISIPTSFPSFFLFYIFPYLFLKTMVCFSGCLMSSASLQKLFCEVCSALKCSFEGFVREKVVFPSYSSAIFFSNFLKKGITFDCFHLYSLRNEHNNGTFLVCNVC